MWPDELTLKAEATERFQSLQPFRKKFPTHNYIKSESSYHVTDYKSNQKRQ